MSRFGLFATDVWRTRRPHTPHQERSSTLRAVVACGELYSCPQVKCKRSVGGCFLSHFVYPKFRQYSTTSASQSRDVASAENLTQAILERIANSVDDTLWVTTRSLQGTKQAKVQTQRVKMAFDFFTDKT